jgi:hypothetical protein
MNKIYKKRAHLIYEPRQFKKNIYIHFQRNVKHFNKIK